jgi:phage repressor protein C with HTH and peptisase S24 domain
MSMEISENDLKISARARIEFIMRKFGWASPYAMSSNTPVKRSSIQRVRSTDRIGPKVAGLIAASCGLNPVWVETGAGEIYAPMDVSSAYAYVPKANARLSAGGGLVASEGFEPERYAFLRSWLSEVATSTANLVLMVVNGDSMEPTLLDGDMVLVDMGRKELLSDGIYAIGDDDVAMVKRLQRSSNHIIVISDNPIYKEYGMGLQELRIHGRVIWFARQLR